MEDFRIGTRLALGFAVVIGIAAAFGGFAYLQASMSNQTTHELRKVTLPLAQLSDDLRSNAQNQYLSLQRMFTTKDSEELTGLSGALRTGAMKNEELSGKLRALFASQKWRGNLDLLMTAQEEFAAALDSTASVARIGTVEATELALTMDAKAVRPAYKNYVEQTELLVATSRTTGEEQPQIPWASNYLPVAVTSLFLIAIVVARLTVRSITVPIREAIGVLENVVQGDLTCRAEIRSGDELGQLMARLNVQLDSHWNAAVVAERLAEGDTTVHVSATSDRDVLGRALVRMRNYLLASTDFAERLADGNLSMQPRVVAESDRLGRTLAQALDGLKHAAEAARRISEGDLTVRVSPLSDKDVLGHSLAKTVAKLRQVVGDFTASAERLTAVGSDLATEIRELSEERARYAVLPIETSIEEMDRVTAATAHDGKLGVAAIGQTVAAMKEVTDRAGLLDEIARKTDLLTLTATVEAARAGEHGLGFGVVANELRRLGERSQLAAVELMRSASGGVRAAEAAGQLIARVVPGAGETANLLRELTSAHAEHRSALEQTEQALAANLSASRKMAARVEDLVEEASSLRGTLGLFRLGHALLPESTGVGGQLVALQKGAGG